MACGCAAWLASSFATVGAQQRGHVMAARPPLQTVQQGPENGLAAIEETAVIGFATGSAEVPPAGLRALGQFAQRVRERGGVAVILQRGPDAGSVLAEMRTRQVRDILGHLGLRVVDQPPGSAAGVVVVTTGPAGR